MWCVYKCCLNFPSYILLVHTCKWILNIPYMHTLCVIFSYFYSIAIGQLQCDFKYFALHFFRYFFNSTRTTKNTFYILFKLWSLLYFEEKDCAALFQCYKFLLNCTFNSVFCNNVMSVWNGWIQQGKNKSKFIGKYMCFLLYRHTCCYMLECISL